MSSEGEMEDLGQRGESVFGMMSKLAWKTRVRGLTGDEGAWSCW